MRLTMALFCMVHLLACDQETSPGDQADAAAAGTSDANGTDVDAVIGVTVDAAPTSDASGDLDLAEIESLVVGDYVLQLVIANIQEIPIMGTATGETKSVGIATIERVGDDFILVEQGCHVDSTSSADVATTIPDAVPRTTPPATATLTFTKDGETLRWTRPQTITLVGVELDNPATDELPTAGDDERIFDQDDDDQPGVTVHVAGLMSGDIYVIQRNRLTYAGTVAGAGLLNGQVTDSSDQSVVGATNVMLNQNIPSSQDPDLSKSTAIFKRTATTYDCDQVVAEADTLFP